MRSLLLSIVAGLSLIGCRDSTSPVLLLVSATVAPSPLHSGDSATIVVSLTNQSVLRARVSGEECPFYFEILDQSGTSVDRGFSPCFLRVFVNRTLNPGETVRATFRWSANDSGGNPLQPGEYTLQGYCTWINEKSSLGFVIEP